MVIDVEDQIIAINNRLMPYCLGARKNKELYYLREAFLNCILYCAAYENSIYSNDFKSFILGLLNTNIVEITQDLVEFNKTTDVSRAKRFNIYTKQYEYVDDQLTSECDEITWLSNKISKTLYDRRDYYQYVEDVAFEIFNAIFNSQLLSDNEFASMVRYIKDLYYDFTRKFITLHTRICIDLSAKVLIIR